MTSRSKPTWHEMSGGRKLFVVLAATVQLTLAACAWADLARRPASEVRGPKSRWVPVIGINFVGPLAYFRWGRATRDEA